MKKRFVIIDGNAIVHRAYHALPPLTTREGKLVNAVYGFLTIFLKSLKDFKPAYIAVAFDMPGKTFRHKEFPAYKAQREKKPQDLYDQIPMIKEVLRTFGVLVVEKQGFEADDLIGTLSRTAQKENSDVENMIVTGDLDALQLVSDQTKVCTLRQGVSETFVYDREAVKERYGITPEQIIDYKALRGDPSDNIPGVPGIGEKTASDLIKRFGTVENVYKALESEDKKLEQIPKRAITALQGTKKEAMLSKRLVTIVQDVPMSFTLEDAQKKKADIQKAFDLFQGYGFKSLLPRLKELGEGNNNIAGQATEPSGKPEAYQGKLFGSKARQEHQGKERYTLVNTQKLFDEFFPQLRQQPFFVFDTETTSLDPLDAELLGISFSWKKSEAYFVSTKELPESLKRLKPIFENAEIAKSGHNMKYDIRVLTTSRVGVAGVLFDTMVASYLLNPGVRQHNLDRLAFEEFGYEMMPIEALIGEKKGKQISMNDVPTEKLSWYSCEDSDFTFRLYEKFSKEIKTKQLTKLFEDIDMPLVPLLAQMEQDGISVDVSYLKSMSKRIHKKMDLLREKIIAEAGTDFNVNSTQQLKAILFDRLKISAQGVSRGKTGLSTAASELEKLKNAHPIIPLIVEYRELAKLASTYLDALPELVNPHTGRIHSSFNQTVAATGRLSSSEPNLQNIPIRTDMGKQIRRGFVAEKGNILLSADYSQIELRIAAALSKDPKMTEAFAKGEDIHTRTAAEIWEVPAEKVTPEMRRNAKAINFGIIYGMGPMGLALGAGITRQDAETFIDKYFLVHKGIRKYLDATIKMAYDKGYVETVFGRRRYFPELETEHPGLKAAAEREAVNHPIQGTAADLIKIAMKHIRSVPEIAQGTWKMILQVHDELVFEIPKDDAVRAAPLLRKKMEQAHDLGVPIVVDVKAGANWGEMEIVSK